MSPPKITTSAVADSGADTDCSAKRDRTLSPEFFDLIYEADPHAADDDYYVASTEFTELHSEIKGGLLQGVLLWSAGLAVVLAAVFYLGM